MNRLGKEVEPKVTSILGAEQKMTSSVEYSVWGSINDLLIEVLMELEEVIRREVSE